MGAKEEIVKSFKELITNVGVPYEKVAVYQICDHAKVSRKTFYVHFKSKADIVDWIVRMEILDSLFQMSGVTKSFIESKAMVDTMPLVQNEMVYKALYADKDFYSRLCCRAGTIDSPLVTALTNNIIKLNSSVLDTVGYDGPSWKREYVSYYYAAGHAVLIQRWIKNGFKESPEQVAALYNTMSTPFWRDLAKVD